MFTFSKKKILEYSKKYDLSEKHYTEREGVLKRTLAKKNYLTKSDFINIGRWKSTRPTKHYESNDDKLVREVSKIAFTTKNEELRIKVLKILNGCNYPLASTILHFKFPNRYTIIDYRVLWSLQGIKRPIKYSYELWNNYVKEIRSLAKQYKVSIRTLDKALWKYSEKKNRM